MSFDRDPYEESRRRHADHKTLRLCRQVLEALQMGVAGHCGDEVLQEVFISAVEPGADASQLEVTVELPAGAAASEVLERLQKARGLLRSLAAEAISRKKVPDLVFRVAKPEE